MEISAKVRPPLPRLGWCATVDGSAEAELLMGDLVEHLGPAFVAGVWDGPVASSHPATAATFMGSAVWCEDGALRVASASHACDRIFSVDTADGLVVSNSLPLALARAGDRIDPGYRRVLTDAAGLSRAGTDASPISIPTARGRRVRMHAVTILAIGPDGRCSWSPRPTVARPGTFAEYRALLAETVRRLVDNARDPARVHPLPTIATLSGGYDSAATAVLAREAGVVDAFNVAGLEHDDRGQPVADVLGLRVEHVPADAWAADPLALPEFLASTSGPGRVRIAALGAQHAGSLVLLGTQGEELWSTERQFIEDGQAEPRGTIWGGHSTREFGLRAGIVFGHVPLIGAVHADAIDRITHSPEMAPWTIGGDYDRPIARRIIEEAGVPRGAFAREKIAGAALRGHDPAFAAVDAMVDRFLAGERGRPPLRWRARLAVGRLTAPFWVRARRIAYRRKWELLEDLSLRWRDERRARAVARFLWAVAAVGARYAAVVTDSEIVSR